MIGNSDQSRFELIRQLGKGGMGEVWLARDSLLQRHVAIKSTLAPVGTDGVSAADGLARLIIEARAAAGLSHPHIATVFDCLQIEGKAFVVMEYVEGRELSPDLINGAPDHAEILLRILEQAAGALDYAHARGVIHRDIKLGNIMVDADGNAKILDFGIAKMTNFESGLTQGMVIGTLEYLSPERFEGGSIDGSTDQYALAVAAYKLLTGSTIFDVELGLPWLAKLSLEPPVPATQRDPSLPQAMDAVFARALAKKAAGRYRNCVEFVENLKLALTPAPIMAFPEHPGGSAKFAGLRWAGVTGLLLLLALIAFVVIEPFKSQPRPLQQSQTPPAAATPPSGAVLGQAWKDERTGVEYAWIPPGSFLFGCAPGDTKCEDDEQPEDGFDGEGRGANRSRRAIRRLAGRPADSSSRARPRRPRG